MLKQSSNCCLMVLFQVIAMTSLRPRRTTPANVFRRAFQERRPQTLAPRSSYSCKIRVVSTITLLLAFDCERASSEPAAIHRGSPGSRAGSPSVRRFGLNLERLERGRREYLFHRAEPR